MPQKHKTSSMNRKQVTGNLYRPQAKSGREDKTTQDAILEEVRKLTLKNPRIRLGIKWLCTYVSIRPGELLGILEEDIDPKQGLLIIRDHKNARHKGPKVVPLLEEDVEFIASLPRGSPTMHFFRRDTMAGGHPAGTKFGPRLMYGYWVDACKILEIEGVHFSRYLSGCYVLEVIGVWKKRPERSNCTEDKNDSCEVQAGGAQRLVEDARYEGADRGGIIMASKKPGSYPDFSESSLCGKMP